MTDKEEDLRTAAAIRSLSVMTESWENDDLSLDDMCDQLDALSDVLDGDKTFSEFTESTNLTGRERLN